MFSSGMEIWAKTREKRWEQLWKKIRENSSDIVGVDFTGKINSDAELRSFVEILAQNTYVHTLTIQGTYNKSGITDEGVKLLSQCGRLKYLDLSFNSGITDAGLDVLAKMPALETLYLRGCSVTPEGISPFLVKHKIRDLRIAITAAQEEEIKKAVTEVEIKLRELEKLSLDQLNQSLHQFIQGNTVYIPRLPKLLQSTARAKVKEWEDSIITGMTLSRHFAKIGWAKKNIAEVYYQQYQRFREEQQRQMQFQPTEKDVGEPEDKKRKIESKSEREKSQTVHKKSSAVQEKSRVIRERSRSLSPPSAESPSDSLSL